MSSPLPAMSSNNSSGNGTNNHVNMNTLQISINDNIANSSSHNPESIKQEDDSHIFHSIQEDQLALLNDNSHILSNNTTSVADAGDDEDEDEDDEDDEDDDDDDGVVQQSDINDILSSLGSNTAATPTIMRQMQHIEQQVQQVQAQQQAQEQEQVKQVPIIKKEQDTVFGMTTASTTKDNTSSSSNEIIRSAKGNQSVKPLNKSPVVSTKSAIKQEDSATPTTTTDNIQAYAMLDFDDFTFYVQTMQILLGRMVEGDSNTESLDIHLGPSKGISRRHAKIFYNFGTQRFELSVIGRNGAFINDSFVEKGVTLPLKDKTRVQIGETHFTFVLPNNNNDKETSEKQGKNNKASVSVKKINSSKEKAKKKSINPSDAVHLKSTLYNSNKIKINNKSSSQVGGQSSGNSTDPNSREGSLTPSASKILPLQQTPTDRLPPPPSLPVESPTAAAPANVKISPTSTNALSLNVPKLGDDFINQLRANAEASVVKKEEAAKAAAAAKAGTPYIPTPSNNPLPIPLPVQNVLHHPSGIPTSTLPGASGNTSIKKEKPKKQARQPKKVYSIEEIPEQYRTKPNVSYCNMIARCLDEHATERGMSLSEIYKGIRDLYPYYFYCPDGWQSSVRHNLSFNKYFRKIQKEGKGWLWGLTDIYFEDKKKDLFQQQSQRARPISNASRSSVNVPAPPGFQYTTVQKPGQPGFPPQFIKQTVPIPTANRTIHNPHPQLQQRHLQSLQQHPDLHPQLQQRLPPSRPISTPTPPKPAPPSSSSSSTTSKLSGDTKKALSYLQQELIRLTKDRKMYDKETTTQILTQALAMTIAQVNKAAKDAGIQGSPLVTLIDKNPGHVTKILTAALNAATIQITKKKGLPPYLPPKTTQQSGARPVSQSSARPVVGMSASNSSNATGSGVGLVPRPGAGAVNSNRSTNTVPRPATGSSIPHPKTKNQSPPVSSFQQFAKPPAGIPTRPVPSSVTTGITSAGVSPAAPAAIVVKPHSMGKPPKPAAIVSSTVTGGSNAVSSISSAPSLSSVSAASGSGGSDATKDTAIVGLSKPSAVGVGSSAVSKPSALGVGGNSMIKKPQYYGTAAAGLNKSGSSISLTKNIGDGSGSESSDIIKVKDTKDVNVVSSLPQIPVPVINVSDKSNPIPLGDEDDDDDDDDDDKEYEMMLAKLEKQHELEKKQKQEEEAMKKKHQKLEQGTGKQESAESKLEVEESLEVKPGADDNVDSEGALSTSFSEEAFIEATATKRDITNTVDLTDNTSDRAIQVEGDDGSHEDSIDALQQQLDEVSSTSVAPNDEVKLHNTTIEQHKAPSSAASIELMDSRELDALLAQHSFNDDDNEEYPKKRSRDADELDDLEMHLKLPKLE